MTNETKFTPGPWKCQECITAPGSEPSGEWCIRKERETSPMAGIAWTGTPGPLFSATTTESNARLIAAAPELLHALKCLRGWMLEPWGADDGPENEAVIYMAEAAIAKAEGRAG